MGLITFLKKMKKAQEEAKILVLGLDCAGKTTILKAFADEDIQKIKPTEGFNVKNLKVDGFNLSVWDLGGQKILRQFWSNYFSKTNAIIYVIDSADEDRLAEAGIELEQLLEETDLKNVPVLVFANKQDLGLALDPQEITEALKLNNITDRKWNIMACSAKKNEGLQDGFEWVIQTLN